MADRKRQLLRSVRQHGEPKYDFTRVQPLVQRHPPKPRRRKAAMKEDACGNISDVRLDVCIYLLSIYWHEHETFFGS